MNQPLNEFSGGPTAYYNAALMFYICSNGRSLAQASLVWVRRRFAVKGKGDCLELMMQGCRVFSILRLPPRQVRGVLETQEDLAHP